MAFMYHVRMLGDRFMLVEKGFWHTESLENIKILFVATSLRQ